MTETNNYIAVTIGPVLDTINLASSPSALWAASYMMSMLSKNICSALIDSGIPETDIVSPYFDRKDELIDRNDGVGLFHDRVIFKADNFDIDKFKDIRLDAIKRTAYLFGFDKKDIPYFEDYFLVSAVLIENSKNPIMDSGKILDCLELSKKFVSKQESNPILKVYNSESSNDSRNAEIIQRVKNIGLKNWQLFDENRKKGVIRSIPDIAKGHSTDDLKKYKYYAVVRSDGDNISKIISNLSSPDEIRNFSKICMTYCAEIADKVHNEYGGVMIYSGGDDLLALMPVEYEGKNIFEFAKEANKKFQTAFQEFKQDVSLSLGIFISYHKFPLYEALEKSANLLFEVAKDKRNKNCLAICLQKHSGQSEDLLIPNKDLPEYIHFHNNCIENTSSEADEKVIYSAMHKFALFEDIFNNAEPNELENVFKNIFDADNQKSNTFLQKDLYEFFLKLRTELNISIITNRDKKKDKSTNYALKMEYMLRIIKFFKEKAGDDE